MPYRIPSPAGSNMLPQLLCLLFLVSVCCHGGKSQSIERSVVASAGDEHQAGNAGLNWTLGEVFTETLQLGGNTYAMGFQQADLQIRHANHFPAENIARVFPNPFSRTLVIQPTQDLGAAWVSIYSITGARVFESELHLNARQDIDLSFLPDGAFILQIRSTSSQSFIILKNTK